MVIVDGVSSPRGKSLGGRPRNTGSSRGENPRAEILTAALSLFAERGFANTTMSAIAETVGLQQSSLYYWFPNKESLLQRVLAVNRIPLEFVNELSAVDQPASLKIYRIIRCDTYQLCRSPIDFNEIERVGLDAPELLADFWRDYSKLKESLRSLLLEGMRSREFKELDPELASLVLLCLDEGVQKRFRAQQHRNSKDLPFQHANYSAEQYSMFAASMSVSSILEDPLEVEKIKVLADEFNDFLTVRTLTDQ